MDVPNLKKMDSVQTGGKKTAIYIILIAAFAIGTVVAFYNFGKIPRNVSEFADKLFAGAITLIVGNGNNDDADLDTITIEKITEPIEQGKPFTLNWNYGENNGTYFINYECAEGSRVELTLVKNSSQNDPGRKISCGENYKISGDGKVTLVANSTAAQESELKIQIVYSKTGTSESARGATVVIIEPVSQTDSNDTASETAKTPETSKPKPQTNANTQSSALTPGPETNTEYQVSQSQGTQAQGKSDLYSNIIAYGTLNNNNEFTATTTLKSTDKIAVRFEIVNHGTIETGAWYFNAVLPTFPSHIFTSESQQSLKPGEKIVFTLGFNKVAKKDGNEFVVNADPANSINEASETNNIARPTISDVKF